jgi:hypothetical protein
MTLIMIGALTVVVALTFVFAIWIDLADRDLSGYQGPLTAGNGAMPIPADMAG